MTKMMIVEINPPPSFHEIKPAKHPRPGPSISSSFGPYTGSFSLSHFFSSVGGFFFSVIELQPEVVVELGRSPR